MLCLEVRLCFWSRGHSARTHVPAHAGFPAGPTHVAVSAAFSRTGKRKGWRCWPRRDLYVLT